MQMEAKRDRGNAFIWLILIKNKATWSSYSIRNVNEKCVTIFNKVTNVNLYSYTLVALQNCIPYTFTNQKKNVNAGIAVNIKSGIVLSMWTWCERFRKASVLAFPSGNARQIMYKHGYSAPVRALVCAVCALLQSTSLKTSSRLRQRWRWDIPNCLSLSIRRLFAGARPLRGFYTRRKQPRANARSLACSKGEFWVCVCGPHRHRHTSRTAGSR